MFLAIQSDANGVPKRRNMWSHVSHHPPMSKNSGDTGLGQWRSSRLENAFTVPAPVDQAWSVLLDVERVAPCLPGAALHGGDGDEFTGTMTIKLGPVTSRYGGTVRVEQADEAARRAGLRAGARDAHGNGTA